VQRKAGTGYSSSLLLSNLELRDTNVHEFGSQMALLDNVGVCVKFFFVPGIIVAGLASSSSSNLTGKLLELRVFCTRYGTAVQGYLAHKKVPPPRTLQ